MFTGIIEEIGTVKNISKGSSFSRLVIGASVIFSDLKLGDSVAVNGVCLTADSISSDTFTADVMPETLKHSSLGSLSPGSLVNLERAMLMDGRFGGHIVSGHIDGTGSISKITNDGNAVRIRIAVSSDILKYIIKKGSITIDGISLTVTDVDQSGFGVSIIPHTGGGTTLLDKRAGDIVNLENDIIGKYIERLMSASDETKQSNISLGFLQKHGF